MYSKKKKKNNYKIYNKKTIQRRITFEKEIAEKINEIISIFYISTGLKLNSSIFINIVLRDFFSNLKTLDEKEASAILKNHLIAYALEEVKEEEEEQ